MSFNPHFVSFFEEWVSAVLTLGHDPSSQGVAFLVLVE